MLRGNAFFAAPKLDLLAVGSKLFGQIFYFGRVLRFCLGNDRLVFHREGRAVFPVRGRLIHYLNAPGGDGEYLVRVGTENRQHVLGHISLLGYRGRIIAPMTTGGPDESALGDPIEILLTEWARQCRKQGGLVVLPHFPNPRAEAAASIVSGAAQSQPR